MDEEMTDWREALPENELHTFNSSIPQQPSSGLFSILSILSDSAENTHTISGPKAALTEDEILEAGRYLKRYHSACEHVVREDYNYMYNLRFRRRSRYPSQFCLGVIGSQEDIDNGGGEHALFILHPRWCDECLEARKGAIYEWLKESRDIEGSEMWDDEEALAYSYGLGWERGRTNALNIPLERVEDELARETEIEYEVLEEPCDGSELSGGDGGDGGIEDLEEPCDGTELGGGDGGIEDLVAGLNDVNMDCAVCDVDPWEAKEERRRLREVHRRGFEEGMRHQARLEMEALYTQDRETRARLFKEALL